jgi:hypothetical protein
VGVGLKVLIEIRRLAEAGRLPFGGQIVELGSQNLYCAGYADILRDQIAFFGSRAPTAHRTAALSDTELERLADGGLMATLMTACGFGYRALDIFEADRTTLFDLNVDAPGADLAGKFDLVTNFGTTEHVMNQLQCFRTMHELARVGGIFYHDLPHGGFPDHGYFHYTPRFFEDLARANGYAVEALRITQGESRRPTEALRTFGYKTEAYHDFGIEAVLRKTSSAPFAVPLETSTSRVLDVGFLTGAHRHAAGFATTSWARRLRGLLTRN